MRGERKLENPQQQGGAKKERERPKGRRIRGSYVGRKDLTGGINL